MTCYANMDRSWTHYAIFFNPADHPGQYVVRGFEVLQGPQPIPHAQPIYVGSSLDAARAVVPRGLHCLPRWPDDAPQVVEVWL